MTAPDPKALVERLRGVHLAHCYQGDYEDGCKYGDDDCPAASDRLTAPVDGVAVERVARVIAHDAMSD